jgi:capsular exopolysaccharide synthesis family protein
MLAESGVKVLLVDADLRRPRVAKFLGLEGSVGLTSVLAQSVDFEDAIQSWGPGGALDVLTAGRFAPNPSELLGSPRMEKLLSHMESQYEVVIIDAPPLLPVTDPAVLGSIASGVLLVCAADGRTHRGELDLAVKNIKAVNATLLGIVINRLPIVRGAHSYYDYKPEVPQSNRRANKRRNLMGVRHDS